MQKWACDLSAALSGAHDPQGVYSLILSAGRQLEFEWCAFGLSRPHPPFRRDVTLVNNYPEAWRQRYGEAGYLHCDPTVSLASRTTKPIVWSDRLFASTPQLWSEAQACGLRVGWAQSRYDGTGTGSLLTLARAECPMSSAELDLKSPAINWLASMAHEAFLRVLDTESCKPPEVPLTRREIEVLRWAAEGKTTEDIATILGVSLDTVKFHTKNAVAKLGSSNKLAAVVRAYSLGLLY